MEGLMEYCMEEQGKMENGKWKVESGKWKMEMKMRD